MMARPHEVSWFMGFIEYFSKNTSIHGVRFLGMKNISRAERILWSIIFIAAFIYSQRLVRTNAKRFIANPTVVTIKKDFRNWENPFPAVTACFVNKVDPEKANNYIFRKWGVSANHAKYEYYMEFVRVIADLTYRTLHKLMAFRNDPILNNVDMVELVLAVHPDLDGVLVTFQTKLKTEWQMVLTEWGLCFSINSAFAELLSPNYSRSENLVPGTIKENLKCHYLNGLCYARYDSDPKMPIEYHIHSHLEVIYASSETPILVGESEEVEVNFRLTETNASPDIRYLTPDQRGCRFHDEPHTKNVPVYAISICNLECRSRWAIKMCGCQPFFFPFLDGKVCDINGLICLMEQFLIFYKTMKCKCPQPCNRLVYFKQVPKVTKWETGYFDQRITFRWGLVPPTTKYHRKILFGLQGLIVSLGGILSLFLGMSFISFQETIYLCCKYFRSRWQERKKNKKIIKVKGANKRIK